MLDCENEAEHPERLKIAIAKISKVNAKGMEERKETQRKGIRSEKLLRRDHRKTFAK